MLSKSFIAGALLSMLCIVRASAAVPPPLPAPVTAFQVGSLHVAQYGSGPKALVFIPGLTCGPWEWSGQIDHFAAQYTVYALTLPGFDGQPAIQGPLFKTVSADFWTLLATRHITKPVVIGHSLGGTMGFLLATQHPELLAGVVSLDGLPILPGMNFVPRAQVEQIAAATSSRMATLTPAAFEQYERTVTLPSLVTSPADVAAIAPLTARSNPAASGRWLSEDMLLDLRPALSKAAVPILLIAPFDAAVDAQYTLTTPAAKQAYYESLIKGAPNARVVMIDHSRHFAMYDQPQAVTADIAAFLAQVSP